MIHNWRHRCTKGGAFADFGGAQLMMQQKEIGESERKEEKLRNKVLEGK